MAMYLTQIKNTNQEVIYHIDCVDVANATITIADLGNDPTQARNSDAPLVNIVRFMSTGALTSKLRVVRDGKNIIACAPENAPFLDFTANGFTENQKNDKDITIYNDVAAPVTGYLVLRKVQGWSTKVENATFGAHDDPTVVGS